MNNIRIGYFEKPGYDFISGKVINENFIKFLSEYAKVIRIPSIGSPENIKNYKLDYLYVDSFNSPLEVFLIREKFQIDIPIIVRLDAVIHEEKTQFVYFIPLIRREDVIYTSSRYAQASYHRISDKVRVHIIPYALDRGFIKKNISYNINNNVRTITYLGRLAADKGIGVLIECMPEILSKVKNAYLNILGPLSGCKTIDYPKIDYIKELEESVKKLNLTKYIHFKGVQLGADKYKLLSQSEVFINPTTAVYEIFGVVNIEALACGVPVIASNWAGINEIVTNGKTGFLINVECDSFKNSGVPYRHYRIDRKELVNLAVNVLRDEKLRARLKQRALKTAECYDYHKVMPKFISLLNKKKRNTMRGSWPSMKQKKVTDYDYLYNKDFLFFLSYFNYSRYNYLSLYEKFVDFNKNTSSGKQSLPKRSSINKVGNVRHKNILRYYLDYLMLRN